MFLYEFFNKEKLQNSNFIHVDIAPLFNTDLLSSYSSAYCLLMYAKVVYESTLI